MTPSRNGHRTDGWPVDDRQSNGYRTHGYVYGLPEQEATPYSGYGPAGDAREVMDHGYRQAAEPATELFAPAPSRRGTPRPPEMYLDGPSQVTPPPPLRDATRTMRANRADWSAIGAPTTPPAAPPPPAPKGPRLRVDWPNCKAHGLCHELLPEAIRLDEWGYPIVGRDGLPQDLLDDARRAVMSCPTLALHIVD